MTRTIEVTELALRDGHQSLLATRMALEDMAPACADIDQAGYWSAAGCVERFAMFRDGIDCRSSSRARTP